MIRIPLETLSPDVLRGVVEAFVLREGTDYGHRDFSLEEKCRHVERQLARGEAEILFDAESRTTNIRMVGAEDPGGRGGNGR